MENILFFLLLSLHVLRDMVGQEPLRDMVGHLCLLFFHLTFLLSSKSLPKTISD